MSDAFQQYWDGPLIPGFEETILDYRSDSERTLAAKAGLSKARRIAKFISKLSSADLWEYSPGVMRPYASGSAEEKHDVKSGIDENWQAHEEFEPGSKEPEPSILATSSPARFP